MITTPGLLCQRSQEVSVIHIKHFSELNTQAISIMQSHGLLPLKLNLPDTRLNNVSLSQDLLYKIENSTKQRSNDLETMTNQIVTHPGMISITVTSLILLVIVVCCICYVKSKGSKGFLSTFMYTLIPGVRADNLMVISIVVITMFIQLMLSFCFLFIIYKLILSLKRRRSCHLYRSTLAPEIGRYHVDLLIPYANGPLSIKISNLAYPVMFYKTYTDIINVKVGNNSGHGEIVFSQPVELTTTWGKTVIIQSPVIVSNKLPVYTGVCYLIYETN
jgi:hypothetical protein